MRRPQLIALALIILSMLISGALGLKTTTECDTMPRISQRISCYHTAAITAAYIGNGYSDSGSAAANICNSIYDKFGLGMGNDKTDVGYRAETERNSCIFDVARITGNSEICDGITTKRSDVSTGLFGDASSQDMCKDEAGKQAKLIKLQTDLRTGINQDSLCNIVFILPMILIGAIMFQSRR